MFGILSGLASAFLFGLSYVFFRKGFDELNDSYAFMLNALIGVLIWIPFSLIIGVDFQAITSSGNLWFWAFGSAILSEAFVLYALAQGKISITGTVFSTYPIFTALISTFVNQEILSVYQGIAIGLIVLGILLIGRSDIKGDDTRQKNILYKSIFIALLSAFFVGIADSYGKLTLETYGFTTFLFCIGIAQPFVAYANLRIRKLNLSGFKDVVFKHGHTKYLTLGSFLNIIGLIFFWYAFDLLNAGIASALTGVYPAIMVIFAYFFLKEKVTKLQYVGVILVFLTVYIFSIYFT